MEKPPRQKPVSADDIVAAAQVIAVMAMEWATLPEVRPMFQEWATAKGCPIEDWSSAQLAMMTGVVHEITEGLCHHAVARHG